MICFQIPTNQVNSAVSFVQANNGTLGPLITEDGHLLVAGSGDTLSMYVGVCSACVRVCPKSALIDLPCITFTEKFCVKIAEDWRCSQKTRV